MNLYASLCRLVERPSTTKNARHRRSTLRRETSRRMLMEGLENRLALATDFFEGPYPASDLGIVPVLVEVGDTIPGGGTFDNSSDLNEIANFLSFLSDDSPRDLLEGKYDFEGPAPVGSYSIDLGGGQSIDITVTLAEGGEAYQFDWISDVGIDLVFVKANTAGLLYDYTGLPAEPTADGDLVTVERLQGKLLVPTEVGISHISFGYDEDEIVDTDETLSIEGLKYNDHNGNGAQDLGDEGIPNWHFTIWVDSNGNGVSDLESFVDAGDVLNGVYDLGETYTDTNGDGAWGLAEVHDVVTDANGVFSYTEEVSSSVLAGGIAYDVQEVLPSLAWVPTQGEDGYTGTFTPIDSAVADLIFGNTNVGSENGKTIGFWSNKNGQALLAANDGVGGWRTALNNLDLRTATGGQFDLSNTGTRTGADKFDCVYKVFRTWLLGATATNMAYMLSAQLAGTQLNFIAGNFGTSTSIYVGQEQAAPAYGLIDWAGNSQGDSLDENLNSETDLVNEFGFANIQALINAANLELGLHGNTTSGSAADASRDYQEALKIAFDGMNNNLAIFAQ